MLPDNRKKVATCLVITDPRPNQSDGLRRNNFFIQYGSEASEKKLHSHIPPEFKHRS